MKKTVVIDVAVMLYAILFLYTAISKLMDFDLFKEQISTSTFLRNISGLIAIVVPTSELLAVLLIAVPRWRLKGFYLAITLMTAFTIYIIAILSFDQREPCSCGGVIELLSWKEHIILNLFFILLAIWGILTEKSLTSERRRENLILTH